MANPVLDITLSPKQYEAFQILAEPETEELTYGGAKGGGKTVLGCYWSYTYSKQIIKDFELKARKYPIVIGFMGRKQSIDFNATTLTTWKRVIPETSYDIREMDKVRYLVVEDKVAIQIGGMDRTETIKKFNSAEYGFYFIDQAEELEEEDIGMLRGTRRLKIDGRPLSYKGLFTANPAICFLKREFIDSRKRGNRYLQALPTDNPFLPEGYIEQLKKAFEGRPELLKAYLLGSWQELDTAFVIIPYRFVVENVNNDQHDKTVLKRLTVCDIASEGEDETVIYDLENARVVDQEIYTHRSTMDTCGRIQAHAAKNESKLVAVDVIGEGRGCYDRLIEVYEPHKDMVVVGYDVREKAEDDLTFGNKKAEDWWKAAEQFREGKCDIPNDPVLIRQLSGVTYRYKSNGKVYVDPSEEIKKKLGCSPDRAVTYIMGLSCLKLTPHYRKPDAYMREAVEDYEYNPDTV